MKDKNKEFIRIISPITLPVILLFDAAVGYYTYFAVRKVIEDSSTFAQIFLGLQVLAVILAVFTTREVLRHGVLITDNHVEFTALDSDNKVRFEEIERIEVQRDTKISFKKNFVNRYSSLIFYLHDDTVLTVELGLTSKRKLLQVENSINKALETWKETKLN